MNPASAFATHFGRLLSQRLREPENLDAHGATLGELTAANEDAVALTWADWHLRVGPEVVPPTTPEILELLSRMAAHGIRELSFNPRTDRAHLLGAVSILTQEPVIGDGGARALSRFALLGSTTMSMVPVVSATQGAADTIAALAPPPIAKAAPEALIVSKSVLDQAMTEPSPVEHIATAPRRIMTSVERPPATYEPPRVPEVDTADSLVARFTAAETNDEVARAVDAMVAFTEVSRKRVGDVVKILLTIIAAELRVVEPEQRRVLGAALKRLARASTFRTLAAALTTTPEKRDDYMRIFAYFGETAADQLIEHLAQAEASKERRTLFDALVELRRGIPTLIYMLGDGRWFVVRNAADLLGAMRAVEAEPRLAWLLGHSDPRVRRSATAALVKLQTPAARAALKEAMKDESPDVRMIATHALAGDKDRGSMTQILGALGVEKDPDVQRTLLVALGKIGTPEAISRLVHTAEPEKGLFKKKPTPLRVAAIVALAESGAPGALAAIRSFISDKEPEVRVAATKALTPARGASPTGQSGQKDW